jgi:WD40 repeat protein
MHKSVTGEIIRNEVLEGRDMGSKTYSLSLIRFVAAIAITASSGIVGFTSPTFAEATSDIKAVANLNYEDTISAVSFSPDGTLAVSSAGAYVSLWNVKSGSLIRRFQADMTIVFSVAFSIDGGQIWSGGSQGLIIWDTVSGALRSKRSRAEVRSISFSVDGAVAVTAGADVSLWDVSSGKRIRSFGRGSFRSAQLSPDGKSIFAIDRTEKPIGLIGRTEVFRGDSAIRKWDVKTQRLVLTIPIGALGTVLALSRDGKTMLSGDTHSVQLWNANSGKLIVLLAGTAESAAVFSPDSKLIVTTGENGLLTWDAKSGRAIQVEGLNRITGTGPIALSPDSTEIDNKRRRRGSLASFQRAYRQAEYSIWCEKSTSCFR